MREIRASTLRKCIENHKILKGPPKTLNSHLRGNYRLKIAFVIMSKLIPWSEYESEYADHFSSEMGAPAKSFRMALGALIIQEKLGTSDRETVEQVRENPYLQYFIGLESYPSQARLPSMLQ